jgi:hypothetical protein
MGATRDDLHRIAAHVLGRRRFAVSGHFGLRASPGGLATPAFGPEPEVLRLAGTSLVRKVGSQSRSMSLVGATLSGLAGFAGADLGTDFSAGPATPLLGPVDTPLHLDAAELDGLYRWFDLGWRVLDAVTLDASVGPGRATVQLWPEHLDAGTAVDLGAGVGVNLGFSGGDAFSEEPYAYVGPWGPERPGDPGYWNAPFGALVTRSRGGDEASCAAFLWAGLALLARG